MRICNSSAVIEFRDSNLWLIPLKNTTNTNRARNRGFTSSCVDFRFGSNSEIWNGTVNGYNLLAKLQALIEGIKDNNANVILKYMPDEVPLLKSYGELPESMNLNEGIVRELAE